MKNVFAVTGNVKRFLGGLATVAGRGAAEATWMTVEGKAGFGKSAVLAWHATQTGAPLIRAKAHWTPTWCLADLVAELGYRPERTTRDLFNQALAAILALREHAPETPIMIDELDHALRDVRVMETIRDLSDLTEIVVVAAGHEGLQQSMKRYPQIHSRVTEFVEFGPASRDDVRAVMDARCEVEVADDVVDRIHKESAGRLRLVLNGIARIETKGKRGNGPVTLDHLPTGPLVVDPEPRRLRTVA